MNNTYDDTLIEQARHLGAATVHEAAGRIGALPPAIRPVDPSWRIAGPARTVLSPTGDNLTLHRAIVAADPGEILVVASGDTHARWGYWGELMSTAAQAAGLEGLVLEGGSRDHAVLPDIGFPVFSLGSCIQGTSKHPSPQGDGVDATIDIGGVTIRTGDLIVGDIDGVVAIPAADADDTIAAGRRRREAETTMLQRLRAGGTTLELLHLD